MQLLYHIIFYGWVSLLSVHVSASAHTCSDGMQRFIVSHHKSGTAFSKIMTDNLNLKTEGCNICLIVHGFATRNDFGEMENLSLRVDDNNCIVHMIRNPFNMIVSGYLFHIKGTEDWTLCPMNQDYSSPQEINGKVYDQKRCTKWDNAILLPSVYRVLDFIDSDRNKKLDGVDLSYYLPPPQNHSYATYLRSIPPELGVIVEYVRALNFDIARMVNDYIIVEHMSVNLSTSLIRDRCARNLCLGSMFGVRKHNWGVRTGAREVHLHMKVNTSTGVRSVLDGLRMPVSLLDRDMVNILEAELAVQKTTHVNKLRHRLMRVLRGYDLSVHSGLVTSYERLLQCAVEDF
mmetsp:Transcript_2334/g.3590  ORF Transcript_2334/g.3590 Transcript_2334/m.3590 type:complete len:346 (+) Transcript_2334:174-1211(+)